MVEEKMMKIYETPSVDCHFFEEERDVLTLSQGTENDNDYPDIGNWF